MSGDAPAEQGDSQMIGWKTLWPGLLHQAASLAGSRQRQRMREEEVAACALILGRSSLEAYLNEYIRWRRLHEIAQSEVGERLTDNKFMQMPADRKLLIISNSINSPEASAAAATAKEFVVLLSRIRNLIIHYKPGDSTDSRRAAAIIEQLGSLGVIRPVISRSWQDQILLLAVASWACQQIGEVILGLEAIPHGRIRSADTVNILVQYALKPLKDRPLQR